MIIVNCSAVIILFVSVKLSATVAFVVETSFETENENDSAIHAFGDEQPSLAEDLQTVNYPNFTQIPTGIWFSCRNREPGFYANPQAYCQVYHHCLPDGRSYAFLCGVGTIFNQRSLTCDHWYNYNCDEAESDYKYNVNFYQDLFTIPVNNVGSEAISTQHQ
ncbi:hypothetical protein CHUAL_006832 [Chamberlinius hualienensis]